MNSFAKMLGDNGLTQFFSAEAGQARRAWLDEQDARATNAMRYVLGPQLSPRIEGALGAVSALSDGQDYKDAYDASGRLMSSRTIPEAMGNALAFAAPAAAVMIPGISNRMIQGGADIAGDAARFVGDEAGGVNLNGLTFYHGTPDGREVRGAGGFSADKPVFLSDSRQVASTYADDSRAFDYQNSVPEIFSAKTSPQRVLDVNAGGADFRGIDAETVKQALSRAGVSDGDAATAFSQIRVRDDGKIRTDDLVKIVKGLGFDAADVANVRDTYNSAAKSKPSTVRMMMNPAQISIDGLTRPTKAQDKAAEILDMLKTGRASEVTDEMMAAADPQHLFNNYDLPMDEASRMARAGDMGFDTGTPFFHGTGADFAAFSDEALGDNTKAFSSRFGHFVTSDPMVASRFGSDGVALPLVTQDGRYVDGGALAIRHDKPRVNRLGNPVKDQDGNPVYSWKIDPHDAVFDMLKDGPASADPRAYVSARKDAGVRGLDLPGTLYDGGRSNWHGYQEPHNVRVMFDPANIRSKFARFDPRLKHLSNLSAAGAGLGIASVLRAQEEEARRQKILGYLAQ